MHLLNSLEREPDQGPGQEIDTLCIQVIVEMLWWIWCMALGLRDYVLCGGVSIRSEQTLRVHGCEMAKHGRTLIDNAMWL